MKKLLLLLALALPAFAQTQHGVNLAWQWSQGSGSACTGFNVFRGTVSGGPYTQVNTAPVACGATASYLDPAAGLTNNVTYFYVVTTIGSGGQSAYSNQASATFQLLPTSPGSLSAVSQ